jgi:AcrR family transcriptional regulator
MEKEITGRKREIVHSSRDLILEGGVQNVTIKNIASKNNISEGAIYKHFRSKKEILLEVVYDFGRELMRAIEPLTGQTSDPIARLKAMMKRHMEFSEEQKGVFFAITAESVYFEEDEVRKAVLGVIEEYRNKIVELLNEAKKLKFMRENINTDAVSFIFFGMIQSAVVQYALTNYTVPPLSKFEPMWKIFIEGIRAE